ncbi:transcriptional regulator GcvA [Hyphomicrobium sp.]|jgi:LysR family glycine cleavage system transcriptional activator|uniref:transcriptional regulator GcvA n=1 Tax=Hyphomicrobium sp. TaxID=82 RepID=UPI003564AAF7
MARRLPPLNALKAFEAAARLSSFSRAADELNVTHAAISRHVRALEADFRTPLFERTGRGVALTEAGQTLAAELTKGFDLIAAATNRFVRPARRKRRLRVTSDPSFAALWLVPRLGTFTARHPGIELIIDASPRLVDFTKEDVDVGIRWGGGAWAGVESKKLADAELTLVCNPKFLRDNPMSSPCDIDGELLIHETAKECWNAWLSVAGIAELVTPTGPTLNGDLAIAAAEAGQGLTLADQIQAGDALAAGRLVRPFDVVATRFGYYLVCRLGVKSSDAAMAFEAWLVAELAAFADGLAAANAVRLMKAGKTAKAKAGSRSRSARAR